MISPDSSNDVSGAVFPSGTGRYAPSPSGDLHLGNLRTAILAWAMARRGGKPFYMRVEDLDRVRPGAAERQLADLQAMGLDWDISPGSAAESTEGKEAGVLYQSTRLAAYERAVQRLREAGLVYECYCTRREIQEASSAPHGAHLSRTERGAARGAQRPAPAGSTPARRAHELHGA